MGNNQQTGGGFAAGLELIIGLDEKMGRIHDKVTKGKTYPKAIHRTVGASAQSTASGFGDYALAQVPQEVPVGRVWNLRSIHLFAGPSSSPGGLAESASGAFNVGYTGVVAPSVSAAAAAAASLTFNVGAYLTSFRIDPAAAWPAGTNQVTVSQLNGSTASPLAYDLPGGAEAPLIVNYGEPIPAPFGNPVISVPAIVGGPAYTINAQGRALGNGVINTAVDIYAGQPPLSGSPGSPFAPSYEGTIETNMGPLPVHKTYSRYVHWIHHGETLYALFNQVPSAGTNVIFLAKIEEYRVEDIEEMYIS